MRRRVRPATDGSALDKLGCPAGEIGKLAKAGPWLEGIIFGLSAGSTCF